MVAWRPVSMAMLKLGAHAVVGGDEDRIAEAGALQVEQAAEAAEVGVRTGPAAWSALSLDRLDERVAGVYVYARLAVGDARCGRTVRWVAHTSSNERGEMAG